MVVLKLKGQETLLSKVTCSRVSPSKVMVWSKYGVSASSETLSNAVAAGANHADM